MPSSADPLAAMAELERRFNGPVPGPLRLLAQHGSAHRVLLLEAEAQAAFFEAMLRGQIALIRRRRADGSFYPALLADLVFYRRHWRHWRRRARLLRAGRRADAATDHFPMAAE